jgi:hypothetical protein
LRRCHDGRGQPRTHLGRETRAEAAAAGRADEGVCVGVLSSEQSGQVRVGGVAHPVVRVAPRPPVRRHGEGDLLRHRRWWGCLGVRNVRQRGEVGAAAAGGGGEVAEELAEARAPAEHPAGRFNASVATARSGGGWAGPEGFNGVLRQSLLVV